MKYLPLLVALAFVMIAGCTSSQTAETPAQFKNIKDPKKLEKAIYDYIGDVRVYYYVKGGLVTGTGGKTVEQRESKFTLINKSHTFYQNILEYRIPKHELFLSNADMYNLLTVLKYKSDFFASGNSINILGDDPVERANTEPSTTRIIAIEQIKDGKVNTSYFHRRAMEHELDKDRARNFNYAQDYVIAAVREAEPRGSSGAGHAGQDSSDPAFREVGRDRR